MADTFDPPALDKEASGLTKKQDDMSRSFSPLNFQQQNQPKEKPETQVSAVKVAQETQKQETQKQAAPKATPADEAFQQKIAAVSQRIGNFSYALQGKVNKFLSASSTKGLGVSEGKMKIDPLTGVAKVTGLEAANIDPVVQEKLAQQAGIKETLSPFAKDIAGKLTAKSFEDVLTEQWGNDPQTIAALDLLNQYDAAKNKNASNSEKAALQYQLEQADKTGLVSGLVSARNNYERMMGGSGTEGMKFFGDSGDEGYSIYDLVQVPQEKLKSEVENAMTLSSGLFGGDFESSLRNTYDTETAKIQNAKIENLQTNKQLQNAFAGIVDEQGRSFSDRQKEYDTKFNDLGNSIAAELSASGSTNEAKVWMEAVSGGHVEALIKTALSDPKSGLDSTQRNELSSIMDMIKGPDSMLDQLVANGEVAIPEIDENGKEVLNPDGTVKHQTIRPDAHDQLHMLQIIKGPDVDKDGNPIDKNKLLKDYTYSLSTQQGLNLGQYFEKLHKAVAEDADLGEEMNKYKTSFIQSMKNYVGSETQSLVRDHLLKAGIISQAEWDKATPEAKENMVADAMEKDPSIGKGLMDTLTGKLKANKDSFQAMQKATTEKLKATKKTAEAMLDGTKDTDPATGMPTLPNQLEKIDSAMPTLYKGIFNQTADLFSMGYKKPGSSVSEYQNYLKILGSHPRVMQITLENIMKPQEAAVFVNNLAKLSFMKDAYSRAVQVSPEIASFYNQNGGGVIGGLDVPSLLASGNVAAINDALAAIAKANDAWTAKGLTYIQTEKDAKLKNDDGNSASGDPVVNYYRQVKFAKSGIQKQMEDAKKAIENSDKNIEALKTLSDTFSNTFISHPADILKEALGSATGEVKSVKMNKEITPESTYDVENASYSAYSPTFTAPSMNMASGQDFGSVAAKAIKKPIVQTAAPTVNQQKIAGTPAKTVDTIDKNQLNSLIGNVDRYIAQTKKGVGHAPGHADIISMADAANKALSAIPAAQRPEAIKQLLESTIPILEPSVVNGVVTMKPKNIPRYDQVTKDRLKRLLTAGTFTSEYQPTGGY